MELSMNTGGNMSGLQCNAPDRCINHPWWLDVVHKWIHALHGGDEKYSTCYRNELFAMISSLMASPRPRDRDLAGFLMHTYGDTYAHRRLIGIQWHGYPPRIGHAGDFHWPDVASNRLGDGTYSEYLDGLMRLFGGNCDKSVKDRLLRGFNSIRLMHEYYGWEVTGGGRMSNESLFARNFRLPGGSYADNHPYYDPDGERSVLPGMMIEYSEVLDLVNDFAKRVCAKCK